MDKKIYFSPGDLVKYNKELENVPSIMQVQSIIKSRTHVAYYAVKDGEIQDNTQLHGVECFWFCKNGTIQKKTFNTKDLTLVKAAKDGR